MENSEGGPEGALDGLEVEPKLEKFHLPDVECCNAICGSSMVSDLTCIEPLKISGSRSAPTVRLLARKKGEWLKTGSSAITSSSARMPPLRRESFRRPICTSRPSAVRI